MAQPPEKGNSSRAMTTRAALMLHPAGSDIPFAFEQTCATLAQMEILRRATGRPIHLDESGTDLEAVMRAAVLRPCDGFAVKLSRMGGLAPMAVFRDICAVGNMPYSCDDGWGGDIVAAACVHVAATVKPNRLDGVWTAQPCIQGHDCLQSRVSIEGGLIHVPEGPGLGVVPDEASFGVPIASFAK